MQIDLPQNEQKKLTLLASEAGFDSVERFVTEHLLTLAQYPSVAELMPLTDEQLRDSLKMCDHSMEEIDSGGGGDARESLLEIGRKRGFSLNG